MTRFQTMLHSRVVSLSSLFLRRTGLYRAAVSFASTSSEQTDTFDDDSVLAAGGPGFYEPPSDAKVRKISRAMEKYLEASQARDFKMKREVEEFELGKRHLANMMGWDPDNITQEDIDKAIEYLLPSSLTMVRSRPVMKHPNLLFPLEKSAAFDTDGRPFHTLFYTSRPGFYQMLSDAADHAEKAQRMEDAALKQGRTGNTPSKAIEITGTEWVDRKQLELLVKDTISISMYGQFIAAMNFLLKQPFAHVAEDFIVQYRKNIRSVDVTQDDLPESVQYDESGRMFAEATGLRARCGAKVRVYADGSGRITVNGETIEDLFTTVAKTELLFPFIILDRLGEFDVAAETWFNRPVTGIPINTQAFENQQFGTRTAENIRSGAVRLAVSRALTVLLPPEDVEKLKFAGLLTRDIRRKERKYPARLGARARPRWQKR